MTCTDRREHDGRVTPDQPVQPHRPQLYVLRRWHVPQALKTVEAVQRKVGLPSSRGQQDYKQKFGVRVSYFLRRGLPSTKKKNQ